MRAGQGGAASRVLLLRPDHMGDVLHTSAAVATLADALPDAEFTYLVGPAGAEVARHGPLADRVQVLEFPGFGRAPVHSPVAPYRLLWQAAERLRADRYEAAVVFRPDHWWGALLAMAAGIPLRLGFQTPDTQRLLTHRLPLDADQHAAERALALAVFAVPLLRPLAPGSPPLRQPKEVIFKTTDEEERRAQAFWELHELAGRRVVGIHPSAGAALKSWPLERWANLADAVAADGLSVLLSGGPGDARLLLGVQERMRAAPAAVLLGQSLGVAAAVYRRCALLAGPDNGPLHLAAAVGTPTVRLYGPAPPAVFGPWPPAADQRVLIADSLACTPCGHLESPPCGASELPACLRALEVTQVLGEIVGALGPARRARTTPVAPGGPAQA